MTTASLCLLESYSLFFYSRFSLRCSLLRIILSFFRSQQQRLHFLHLRKMFIVCLLLVCSCNWHVIWSFIWFYFGSLPSTIFSAVISHFSVSLCHFVVSIALHCYTARQISLPLASPRPARSCAAREEKTTKSCCHFPLLPGSLAKHQRGLGDRESS